MDYHLALKFILIIASVVGLRRFNISRMKHLFIILIVDLYYNCMFVLQVTSLIFTFTFLPITFSQIGRNFNSETPIKKILLHSFPFWNYVIYYFLYLYICLYARINLKNCEKIIKTLHKRKRIWEETSKNILYLFCCVMLLLLFFGLCTYYIEEILTFQENIFFSLPQVLADIYSLLQIPLAVLIFWAIMGKLSYSMKLLGKRNIQILKQKCESMGKITHISNMNHNHPEITSLKVSLIRFHTLLDGALNCFSKPVSLLFAYGVFYLTSQIVSSVTLFNSAETFPIFLLSMPCTLIILLASDSVKEEVSGFLYAI